MNKQNNVINSLAHKKWSCKYHIVFAPKNRRKVFYNEKREAIREIIKTLSDWKGVEIIEGEICPDFIYLLKFTYRNREFWCKRYYVDTVRKNTRAIKAYIPNQS